MTCFRLRILHVLYGSMRSSFLSEKFQSFFNIIHISEIIYTRSAILELQIHYKDYICVIFIYLDLSRPEDFVCHSCYNQWNALYDYIAINKW